MIYLLVGFFLTCFFALFVSSWRVALLGLGLQGVFMGALLIRFGNPQGDPASAIQLAELLAVKALLLPVLLIGVLRRFRTDPELDLIPANLVAWIFAGALMILAYWFGQRLFPEDLGASLHLGTVAFGVLAALFILSLQSQPLGQIIALLLFESAISLFEVSSGHSEPVLIQAGISLVFLALLILVRRFLYHFRELEISPETTEPEREVL